MRPKISSSFRCQWREWFCGSWNWKNLDLITFNAEYGSYKGRYLELNFALLGLTLCVEIYDPLSRSVFGADMDQKIAAIRDGEKLFDLCPECGQAIGGDDDNR